ncbi:hypothetical protein HS125_07660 [bacterium]|nr:hypothetical protein [bacterium]
MRGNHLDNRRLSLLPARSARIPGWKPLRPGAMNVRMGEMLELELASLTAQGEGLARWQGQVVFVPRALAGERVRAETIQA